MVKQVTYRRNLEKTTLSSINTIDTPSFGGGKAVTEVPRAPLLVIADPGVEDVEILLESLAEGTPVLRIGENQNPLDLIASALREYRPIRLHFVCHGEPGAIRLGGSILAGEPLATVLAASHPAGLEQLCLWACETAGGDAGRKFLQTLANKTGARVHGAAGPVGNPGRGGSWELPICAAPPTRSVQPRLPGASNPVPGCSQDNGAENLTH